MRRRKSRYKQGSIKRLKRARGYVWQVRFSAWKDGKRFQRTLALDGGQYHTEKDAHDAQSYEADVHFFAPFKIAFTASAIAFEVSP